MTTKERAREAMARAEALDLLQKEDFFNQVVAAVNKAGVEGEEQNVLALYIVATSRYLERPLNAIVKGQSAGGKNWVVSRVLQQFPRSEVREISSTSERAWNYSEDDFHHKVVYLQERNEASGGVHPARLLISEGKLIHTISTRCGRSFTTEQHVARGPIAFISTTTKNQIQIDDETRHISLWVNESEEQSRRIIVRSAADQHSISRAEVRKCRQVQRLLKERAGAPISLPKWFPKVAEATNVADLRVRRYFPAFVQACKTICLLRSFQRDKSSASRGGLEVDFVDFALAALILESVFSESLHRGSERVLETRQAVARVVTANKGKPISARQLAKELGISKDRTYADLRRAMEKGAVHKANRPERSNRKLFLPAPLQRFIPDPKVIFDGTPEISGPVRFVHPFTGKPVTYKHSHDKSKR